MQCSTFIKYSDLIQNIQKFLLLTVTHSLKFYEEQEARKDVFLRGQEESYERKRKPSYTNPEEVEVCTLERGISLTVRNDAAFVLDSNLSIYEHQSTICPNMPIRSLIYFTFTIKEMLKGKNIYGRRLLKIPVPKFAVFYNGDEEQPDQYDMALSSAFEHQVEEPQLELKCTVYNINHGRNKSIMKKCPVLKEYSIFVNLVKVYHKEQNYENLQLAIQRAIDKCIKDNVLREFLINRRLEVVKVMQMDYTFERQLTLEREDARSEGWREGQETGRVEGHAAGLTEGHAAGLTEGLRTSRINIICKKLSKNKTIEQIADELETEVSEITPICEAAAKYAPDYDVEAIYREMYLNK